MFEDNFDMIIHETEDGEKKNQKRKREMFWPSISIGINIKKIFLKLIFMFCSGLFTIILVLLGLLLLQNYSPESAG